MSDLGPSAKNSLAHILIVDDEESILRFLEYSFAAQGYRVTRATSGLDGIAKAKSENPDLIILDVMMPDISGLEVCDHLRADAKTRFMPIIMLSAAGQVDDRVSGLRSGADDYVTKPANMDELMARVTALLNRTRRMQSQADSSKRGKVIGFIGAKGGVGTTTTVLNLGTLLALRGKPVTAIELHAEFGSFYRQFGRSDDENLSDLMALDPALLTARTISARLSLAQSGLKVLCGPRSHEELAELDDERVLKIIDETAQMTEYLLLDLPHSANPANAAACKGCDLIIVITSNEPDSIQSAKSMLDVLKSWGIVGNMVGIAHVTRTALGDSMPLREIARTLGHEIVGTVPFAGDLCAASYNKGVQLVQFQPGHLVTSNLNEMLDRITAETLTGLRF